MDLAGRPGFRLIDELHRVLAIERLRIEQIVIPKWHRVDGQLIKLTRVLGDVGTAVLKQLQEPSKVMNARVLNSASRHDGLEALLDCLLGMEADDAVGDLRIRSELPDGGGVLAGLPGEKGGQICALSRRQVLARFAWPR